MPEPRWKGFIKDYSGSTMMQCMINKDIDYVNLSDTLKIQKDVKLWRYYYFIGYNRENQIDYSVESLPWLKV